jgi:hypothetical protein
METSTSAAAVAAMATVCGALETGLLLRCMADGLDVVAVRIVDEGAVVVLVVVGTDPGGPVVLSAGHDRRLVEAIDRLPIRCAQRDVRRRARSPRSAIQKLDPSSLPNPQALNSGNSALTE